MKKIRLIVGVLGFLLVSGIVMAQDFRGDWRGTLDIEGRDSTVTARIVIAGGSARQYFSNGSGGWRLVDPINATFTTFGNNATLSWINAGGIWTETQTYNMTLLDDDTVEVLHIRHVNNRHPGGDGDPWFYMARGVMTRQ
jgi:hypothetical protein